MTHCAGGSGRAPGWMWPAVGVLCGFYILVLCLCTLALAHDDNSHPGMAQNDREWFGQQKIPGGGNAGDSCCSQSDGEFAEEDIRDNDYWAKWSKSGGQWLKVPDETIIKKPNPHGRAAVWWGGSFTAMTLYIRCFIAGALF